MQVLTGHTHFQGSTTISPPYAVYAPTKGAIEVLARVLAKDLGASKKIRVNVVSCVRLFPLKKRRWNTAAHVRMNWARPGPTATALFFDGKSEEMIKTIEKFSPMSRLAQPEEIANAVVFMADDKHASWVSGQNLRVNGAFV
jgi:3-oxoacyl-[acyl-carrier protein] reductase